MGVYRIITIALLMTVTAMGYVHQKVEIIKAGYELQKSRKHLTDLVYQNSALMYNLSKLESPRSLLTYMDGDEIEFAKSRAPRTRMFDIARLGRDDEAASGGLFSRFFDLFTPSAEARPRK